MPAVQWGHPSVVHRRAAVKGATSEPPPPTRRSRGALAAIARHQHRAAGRSPCLLPAAAPACQAETPPFPHGRNTRAFRNALSAAKRPDQGSQSTRRAADAYSIALNLPSLHIRAVPDVYIHPFHLTTDLRRTARWDQVPPDPLHRLAGPPSICRGALPPARSTLPFPPPASVPRARARCFIHALPSHTCAACVVPLLCAIARPLARAHPSLPLRHVYQIVAALSRPRTAHELPCRPFQLPVTNCYSKQQAWGRLNLLQDDHSRMCLPKAGVRAAGGL